MGIRISNGPRFANRVVFPSSIALLVVATYCVITGVVVLVYGFPVTLIVLVTMLLTSLWLAQYAEKLRRQ
jgi:ABC-type transport system involved in cytochrome bd biosynthesis fused ATPase/permease subunit